MTKKKTIVLLDWTEFPLEYRPELEKNQGFDIQYKFEKELTDQDFNETEVLIGNCKHDLLKKFRNLKWLQLATSGADGYTTPGVLPKGTLLSGATGTFGITIAEYLMATTLLIQRKLHRYMDNQRQSLWQKEGDIQSIYGSTFLIIGLGDIGTEFAKRVKALGGYTIGIKRTIYGNEEHVDEVYTNAELDNQIPKADVIVSSVPNTPETLKMYNANRFAKMKKNAIFINVGRGNAVDTEALCDALQNGELHGAVLDVTDPEPLPKEHRAWQIPNLVITPHVSGNYDLKETKDRLIDIVTQNMEHFLNGTPLQSEIDFQTGYSKKKL